MVKELRAKLINMYLFGEGTQKEFEDTLALLVGLCMLDLAVGGKKRKLA